MTNKNSNEAHSKSQEARSLTESSKSSSSQVAQGRENLSTVCVSFSKPDSSVTLCSLSFLGSELPVAKRSCGWGSEIETAVRGRSAMANICCIRVCLFFQVLVGYLLLFSLFSSLFMSDWPWDDLSIQSHLLCTKTFVRLTTSPPSVP